MGKQQLIVMEKRLDLENDLSNLCDKMEKLSLSGAGLQERADALSSGLLELLKKYRGLN